MLAPSLGEHPPARLDVPGTFKTPAQFPLCRGFFLRDDFYLATPTFVAIVGDNRVFERLNRLNASQLLFNAFIFNQSVAAGLQPGVQHLVDVVHAQAGMG